MPYIKYNMNRQIASFYKKNAEMFKRPLEMILNKMFNDCRYINKQSLERHNFGGKPIKINNLPDINSENYEEELINILKNDNEDNSIIELLWGDIQLGKRVQACIIMWISTYILKRPVLYIFRNLKIDKSQLMGDISGVDDHDYNITYIKKMFKDFSEELNSEEEDWKDFKLPELKDIDNNDNINKLSNKEKIDSKDILCCLMNHTQLEKVNSELTKYLKLNGELVNLTVITDESDLAAPSASNDNKNDRDIIDATKCEKLLASIYLKVRYVLHITGTAHTLLYNTTTRLNEEQSIQLKISRVHKMKRTTDYFGLFNNNITYNTSITEWWNLIDPDTNKKYKYDIISDYHWNIKSIITEILKRKSVKYNSLLISEEKIRRGQFELINNIMRDFSNLFIIVFHGKCLRIYIPTVLIDKILKYSQEEGRLFKPGGIHQKDNFKDKQNMGDLPNNYCYIDIDDKMFNIKQVYKLLSLMINNESNINKTVITVTGKYGERGYSFTSDDYGDNSFHLTDQYYPCHVKNKNCTDISQRLRLQGKYKDNPDLTLWTSKTLKDIMEGFYIPFMKSIENEIMKCQNYEEIRDLVEDIIDTNESINFNHMKYISPIKYKKNIKKEKRYDHKHKGYRLIKFNGINEEQLSKWCSEHNLPTYECVNEIMNDLSTEEFIKKNGDYEPLSVFEIETDERERTNLIKYIKENYSHMNNFTLDRMIKCSEKTKDNNYERIKQVKDNPKSKYVRKKLPNSYNIIYHEDKNIYPNILITGLTDKKMLPSASYRIDKSYHIDEEDNVFYSELKSDYKRDGSYEGSPYYWKTPDGWLYLYHPERPNILSLNIKRNEELCITDSNSIIIDENVKLFKDTCISETSQSNLRIGINTLMKIYKDWCISNSIQPLKRKQLKEELAKLNIKEETSKGIDNEGRSGKRGYNISI